MAIGIGRAFVIVGVISASLALLAKSSAWVFHADDRRPSHSTMVGSLEFELPEGKARGTAVLVDDCGILTNFHVVFGPWYATALRPPSRDYPGRFTLTEAKGPDGVNPTARAIPVIWGDYRGPDRHLRSPQQDWAYLALDPCVGSNHVVLRAFDPAEFKGTIDPFAALGYSTGRQLIDPACAVRGTSGAIALPGSGCMTARSKPGIPVAPSSFAAPPPWSGSARE